MQLGSIAVIFDFVNPVVTLERHVDRVGICGSMKPNLLECAKFIEHSTKPSINQRQALWLLNVERFNRNCLDILETAL